MDVEMKNHGLGFAKRDCGKHCNDRLFAVADDVDRMLVVRSRSFTFDEWSLAVVERWRNRYHTSRFLSLLLFKKSSTL